MIKHLSLFSGLGGASSALAQAGKQYITLGISEINQRSLRVYQRIHGTLPQNEGDIVAFSTDISRHRFYVTNEVPDLITGGFPCQPFSLLNLKKHNKLTNDPRFMAALAMQKIVTLFRPKYVLLENVKAITNKTYWPHIKRFLAGFSGYDYVIDFQNPSDYGYHQSRGRNYILMTRSWSQPMR